MPDKLFPERNSILFVWFKTLHLETELGNITKVESSIASNTLIKFEFSMLLMQPQSLTESCENEKSQSSRIAHVSEHYSLQGF